MRKILKKAAAMILVAAISMSTIVIAHAEQETDVGMSMHVPLRRVFMYAGGNVEWSSENRHIVATHGDDTYIFYIGSRNAYRNGEAFTLEFDIISAAGNSYISFHDAAFLFEHDSGYFSNTVATTVTSTLSLMSHFSIPGVTVALVDAETGFVWTQGFGWADTQEGILVDEYTLFPLASIAKPFTAVAVMQLAEAGIIDIDNPIVTYLPDFYVSSDLMTGEGDYSNITIRMLMSHASGIMTDIMGYGAVTIGGHYAGYMNNFIEILAAYPMITPEASAFNYSNNAFTLLGILVAELATDYDCLFYGFNAHMAANVFTPIGMDMTTFILQDRHMPYLAQPYVDAETPDVYVFLNALPTGGIISNARDMSQFMLTILSAASDTLLEEATIVQMFERQDFGFEYGVPDVFVNINPGLGFWHASTGLDGFAHSGHGGNLVHHHSHMGFDRDSGIGVLVSVNSITGAAAAQPLAEAILQAAVFEKTGTLNVPASNLDVTHAELTQEELAVLDGFYVMIGASSFIEIIAQAAGVLHMYGILEEAIALMPLSDGSFFNPDFGLRLWFDIYEDDGEYVVFMRQGEFRTHVLGTRAITSSMLAPDGFEQFVGLYLPVMSDGQIPLATHIEARICAASGFAYMMMTTIHGQASLQPLVPVGDYSTHFVATEFTLDDDGTAWLAFAGLRFVRTMDDRY